MEMAAGGRRPGVVPSGGSREPDGRAGHRIVGRWAAGVRRPG
jgi:hypothetical protein